MCIFAPLKTRNRLGLLAQLVQSIWFTPRGSGVRIPQGPQKSSNLLGDFFLFLQFSFIHGAFRDFLNYLKNLEKVFFTSFWDFEAYF